MSLLTWREANFESLDAEDQLADRDMFDDLPDDLLRQILRDAVTLSDARAPDDVSFLTHLRLCGVGPGRYCSSTPFEI